MQEGRNPEQASVLKPRRKRWAILLWVLGAVVAVVGSITAAYYFDVYTESRAFCGALCHPNRPEYVTHTVAPHASVECGTCHVGPGLFPKVTAKIYGVQELVALITNTYERPIEPPVARLRPAREICEQCHSSGKTYDDSLRLFSTFASDEKNSETRTQLLMRMDERVVTQAQGATTLRTGAHWHVANPVWYVARDANRQDIPWVGMTGEGGQIASFELRDKPLTAAELGQLPMRQMDCLDCHNRPAHPFRQPEQLVDEALASGRLDRNLPFLKREAVKLLSAAYPTQAAGKAAMAQLRDFYRSQYAGSYDSQAKSVEQAVTVLQEIYYETVFPEMNLTWQVYPNNIGHKDSAGCFRCHDGQHLNAQGEVIPLRCNLCHSVPTVTTADRKLDPAQSLAQLAPAGTEPGSHRAADFLSKHRVLVDESCATCHGTTQYGTDGSSFCANPACHAQKWPRIAIDAGFVHPVALIGQHAQAACSACHKTGSKPQLNNCATCHQPPRLPHFGQDCSRCHTPEGWRQSAAGAKNAPAIVAHRVADTLDCLTCHAAGKRPGIPATHAGYTSALCLQCHKAGTTVVSAPRIPHTVEERGNCLVCHADDRLEEMPDDHQGWGSTTCLLCHASR